MYPHVVLKSLSYIVQVSAHTHGHINSNFQIVTDSARLLVGTGNNLG